MFEQKTKFVIYVRHAYEAFLISFVIRWLLYTPEQFTTLEGVTVTVSPNS